MVPSERVTVHNSGLVLHGSLQDNIPLLWREKLGFQWGVGKPPDEDEGIRRSDGPSNEKE